MDSFKKGEIAIFKYLDDEHGNKDVRRFDGAEVEIRSSCFQHRYFGSSYDIEWPDGMVAGCSADMLKKKKPPKKIDWVKMCNLDKLPEIA